NPNDALHERATEISLKLIDQGVGTAILNTTLGEFALLAASKIGRKQAQRAVKELLDADTELLDITPAITKHAVALYQQQTSKDESLFDCYVMAAAKTYNIPFIFSFDKGYKKNSYIRAF